MDKVALIDADILRYECSSVGQDGDEIRGFDFVRDVFDERVRIIIEGSGCENYRLFITGDETTHRINERRSRSGQPYVPNFRTAFAVGKSYKGTRKQEKPFHWINLTAYILSKEAVRIANGFEADDAIALESTDNTVICTRDKDLRQVPGWHYGWECGKQPEFGPIYFDSVGSIDLVRGKSSTKIVGGGFKFFCSQLLTGDVVDNIGGAKGVGPVKAYEILKDCATERDAFSAVKDCYQGRFDAQWRELLEEQCMLLYIIRERNEDGSLKFFNIEEWL